MSGKTRDVIPPNGDESLELALRGGPSRRRLLGMAAASVAVGASRLGADEAIAAPSRDFGRVLIAYYSRTGNTRAVANAIRAVVPGDLFELKTTHTYPAAYRATTDQAKREQETNLRPKLVADVAEIETYHTVFLGFPNWWSTMPMAFFTFLEHHRLAGKTVVPFCTHEGSNLGSGVSDIRRLCRRQSCSRASRCAAATKAMPRPRRPSRKSRAGFVAYERELVPI